MVIRLFALAAALILSCELAQARDSAAPKPQPSGAVTTADPLDVPRGMRDWFAKSVDDMLTDDEPAPEGKPARRH